MEATAARSRRTKDESGGGVGWAAAGGQAGHEPSGSTRTAETARNHKAVSERVHPVEGRLSEGGAEGTGDDVAVGRAVDTKGDDKADAVVEAHGDAQPVSPHLVSLASAKP